MGGNATTVRGSPAESPVRSGKRRWDAARLDRGLGDRYQDDDVLIATDYEGGNGARIRRLDSEADELTSFALDLEPDPGEHRFRGVAYFLNVALVSFRPGPLQVRLRVHATCPSHERWDDHQHMVLRRRGRWRQLPGSSLRPSAGAQDVVDILIDLPGASSTPEADVVFVSNFHWWPYSECLAYLRRLQNVRLVEIGRSAEGRPLVAAELGRADDGAPTMVHAATPQPSEMGALSCKAMLDHLTSGAPGTAALLDRYRLCFIPMPNPDGSVLGYTVSDARGHFPYFEADAAAENRPDATPENMAVWRYLTARRPWLFWEWHSNNWARRPGHMLLRYRPDILAEPETRSLAAAVDERLCRLPDTYTESFTSHTEGNYQTSMGFQAATRLGAVSCMIKQHDKLPLPICAEHAVSCLRAAHAAYSTFTLDGNE
jgi:hypothetical protein